MGNPVVNILHALFGGGLTQDNSALQSPNGEVALSSPAGALKGANQALNAAGPSTNFDVQDGAPVLSANPNQAMLPKIFRPSFAQASKDSAGNVTKINPSETKMGVLAHILRGGIQGGMDAIANGALDAPQHGESKVTAGVQGALQMPVYRAGLAQQKQRQGLENQVLQSQVGDIPAKRQKEQADLANVQAQTAWHNSQVTKNNQPQKDAPLDQQYLDAVARGDTTEAQRLLKAKTDLAAAGQDAKPDKAVATAESLKTRIAAAYEKGDTKEVARLQKELKAVDPLGAERINISLATLNQKQETASRKDVAAHDKAYVEPANNVEKSFQMMNHAYNEYQAAKREGKTLPSGAQSMLALSTHLATTFGNVKGARVTKDMIAHHLGARSISDSALVAVQKLTNGDVLSPNQWEAFHDLIGESRKLSWQTAVKEAGRKKIPVDFLPSDLNGLSGDVGDSGPAPKATHRFDPNTGKIEAIQ